MPTQGEVTSINRDTFTTRQGVCIVILFIFSGNVLLGYGSKLQQDIWFAILLAISVAIPVVLMYARILRLFPGCSLYEVSDNVLGKVGGKVFSLLFSGYALFLASLVLDDFTEFIKLEAMPETPRLVIAVLMLCIILYLSYSGMRVLGKWSVLILPVVLLMMLLTLLFGIPSYRLDHIFPIFNHSVDEITTDTINIFSFPFGEIVLLLGLGNGFGKNTKPTSVLLTGLLIGGILLFLVFVRNLLILGVPSMENVYFPSFMAARLISVGESFTRIEGAISYNYLIAGLTKITVCLLVSAKGFAHIFGLKDYKILFIPISLVILIMALVQITSILDLEAIILIYPRIAIPFQLLPLVLWIPGEIKNRIQKKKNAPVSAENS